MGMTQMVQPNEITRGTTPGGWPVTMQYVAGGSFVQVQVRDTLGVLAFNHHYMSGWDAARKFQELTAAA